jgi:lipoprotein-anchoring transpeptidase ErfK/SrfK
MECAMTGMHNQFRISRRAMLGGLAFIALPGCTTTDEVVGVVQGGPDAQSYVPVEPAPPPPVDMSAVYMPPEEMYAAVTEGEYALPAIPFKKIDPKYYRQAVPDPTGEAPGTIVVDTANRFLYLVQPFGEAVRYGVAIGKEGFAWSGNAEVGTKGRWPKWTPPAEMIKRDPTLEKYSNENGGMPPGPKNPLGARALYIYKDGIDTLYRIHGSPEWKSIGKKASSGCVRMMNQDVIDLYNRVPQNAPIVVRDEFSPLPVTA